MAKTNPDETTKRNTEAKNPAENGKSTISRRSLLKKGVAASSGLVLIGTVQGKDDDDGPDGDKSDDVEECVQAKIEKCIERRKLEGKSPKAAKKACNDPAVVAIMRSFCKNPITIGEFTVGDNDDSITGTRSVATQEFTGEREMEEESEVEDDSDNQGRTTRTGAGELQRDR